MEREGVTKFELDFTVAPVPESDLSQLNLWRRRLQELTLLGEIPTRYGGLGFGNLSQRYVAGFLITGSQTSGVAHLPASGYAWVTAWDLASNMLSARGQTRPSSESLTHAALYALSPEIKVVFHVHSPVIWHEAASLSLTMTDARVAYGTPEMAREVQRLNLAETVPGLFCMGGHEDGVVAYGRDCQDAGQLLLETLSRAGGLLRP
jgi:ribulose-5-phosphate 4-epimerase/fuculose-1-phosphate aldolase